MYGALAALGSGSAKAYKEDPHADGLLTRVRRSLAENLLPSGVASTEPEKPAPRDGERRVAGLRCASAHARFELQQGWRVAFGTGKLFPRMSARALLAVRVALFASWLGVSLWSFFYDRLNHVADADALEPHAYDWEKHWADWFTKLTHWTLCCELLYLLFGAVVTGLAVCSSIPDGKDEATPWFVRLTWALGANTIVASFFVMVLYWALDW